MTEHTGRKSIYAYDKLGRLTAETITDAVNGNHTATYTYDKVGNRLTQTVNGTTTSYSYNANDWLLKAGAIAYTYDANGNTLTETDGINVKQYAYNAENKLIKQTANGQSASFAYNPNGLRIAKTIGTTKTTYLLDSMSGYGDVVAEYKNGTKAKTYTLGDDLISQTVGGNTHYFGYDGLGSTRVLFDSTGTVSDSYDYTAFGEMHGETGTTDNEFKFTGEQYDSTLKMYNLRARYYNQNVGRFYGLDTYQGRMSDPATLHKYLYTGNDPINMIDPTGHFGIGSFGAAGNIMGSLMTISARVNTLLKAYDLAESTVGYYNLLMSVRKVFGDASSFSTEVMNNVGVPAGIDFKEAAFDASINLPKAIGTGIFNWADGYSRSKRKGKKLTGFLIYMPLLMQGGSMKTPPIKTPAKVRFGNKKVPIKLVFGAKREEAKGQLTGIGMEMGIARQLVRMDWHPYNEGHGGTSGVQKDEIAVWRSGDYHYHVNKWNSRK